MWIMQTVTEKNKVRLKVHDLSPALLLSFIADYFGVCTPNLGFSTPLKLMFSKQFMWLNLHKSITFLGNINF